MNQQQPAHSRNPGEPSGHPAHPSGLPLARARERAAGGPSHGPTSSGAGHPAGGAGHPAGPRRFTRRDALATLGGLGIAGLAVGLVGPARRLLAEPARPFPAWAYSMPRGGEAYAAAYRHLELIETLPCYCGCMRFETPHRGLRDCFQDASGEPEPHGAFCETCQDEAIDAAAWAEAGVAPAEIHDRIVAKFSSIDPMFGGAGCGATASSGEHGEGAACTP